ncbi:hypothetical protein BaRGS_00002668, partial [Batillaria attramentaria]
MPPDADAIATRRVAATPVRSLVKKRVVCEECGTVLPGLNADSRVACKKQTTATARPLFSVSACHKIGTHVQRSRNWFCIMRESLSLHALSLRAKQVACVPG